MTGAVVSRSLDDLAPDVGKLARYFLDECQQRGLAILVTCTYRNHAAQAQLWACGRTVPGKILTCAQPGQSLHNYTDGDKPAARAFDVVPMVAGRPMWATDAAGLVLWQLAGDIGESVGLEWAGRWKSFKEFPHFQKTS